MDTASGSTYYIQPKADSVGYHPEIVLAGRRINNSMGKVFAEQTIEVVGVQVERPVSDLRVGVFGLTFKENVLDLREQPYPDIVNELKGVWNSSRGPRSAGRTGGGGGEYGLRLSPWDQLKATRWDHSGGGTKNT